MKIISYFVLVALFSGCINKPEVNSKITTIQTIDTLLSGNLIADTIIYDVIIRSSNPNDEWENQRLQYLNQSAFVDSLFNLVYDKEIIAYDVFENKPLSISQVKLIEKQDDFARNRIGKVQFTEKWYFNPTNQELQKQILSIALGYETYDENGEVRAYKPVFKLYFN
jgi:hypothetical protein